MQNFKPELIDYRYEPGTDPTPALSVELSEDGKVLWVNFDGVCVFRACNLPKETIVEIKGMLVDNVKRNPNKRGWMWVSDDGELGSIVYDKPARVEHLVQWRKPVEIFIVDEEHAGFVQAT